MKAKKLFGIIFTTIGVIILVVFIAVVAVVIKQVKDSAADRETMEQLVEALEQAKATPLGASAIEAFVTKEDHFPKHMKITVQRSGCNIFKPDTLGGTEPVEEFKKAMDSINPNWRTDYTSKRDVMYEIYLYGGTGEMKFGRVPSGFSK